jgi:prephenate dehydrogenase
MTIGIVGTGLIGASVGMSLKAKGYEILGHDSNPTNLKIARERYAIDMAPGLETLAKECRVVFICVPPALLIPVSKEVVQLRGPETVVTDCGSIKQELAEWAKDHPWFVPGHPMAGHEKGGPKFASNWLFRGAKWIITPHENNDESAVKQVEQLVREMQATPIRLRPEVHDKHVGVLSHLPHILAALLLEQGSELGSTQVGGGSWKDLTRVAGVDPNLWTQILLGNRRELVAILSQARSRLEGIETALENGDETFIHNWLLDMQKVKDES